MIVLLSPSKTLNESPVVKNKEYTLPVFLEQSSRLVDELKKYSPSELEKLMKVNPKLSTLNVERYLKWNMAFHPSNAYPSMLMFKGEVYNGLKAETMEEEDLLFAQQSVRILSGLYGMLKPLDLMMAYRLEMGTSLSFDSYRNLYEFWDDRITEKLNQELSAHSHKFIINLASDEYFKAIDPGKINAQFIKCQFKEERNGKLKFITVYGKKARGLMTRYIIDNRITNPEDIKTFDLENYYFNVEKSTDSLWLFTR